MSKRQRLFNNQQRITLNGIAGTLVDLGHGEFEITFDDGNRSRMTREWLERDFASGRLAINEAQEGCAPMRPVLMNDAQVVELDFEEAFLRRLDQETTPHSIRTRQAVIAEVAHQRKLPRHAQPSPSKLYRSYRRWTECGRNARAFINRNRRSQSPRPRLSEAVQTVLLEVIDDVYMTKAGPKPAECYRIFRSRLAEVGLEDEGGSRATFYRWIKALHPVEVVGARQGADAARRLGRVVGPGIDIGQLLARVEVDAVHLNLGLVDDDGSYLGKVIVYVAIDACSRAIIGYSYAYGNQIAECASKAAACLRHAFREKTREEYPFLENDWEMHGIPLEVVSDSGPAFESNLTRSLLSVLGVHAHRPQSRTPWRRPFIERFFLTLRNQLLAGMPGYRGSRSDKSDYDEKIDKASILSFRDFERRLVTYFVDVYNQRPHKGLGGATPAQVWQEKSRLYPPRQATDEELDIIDAYKPDRMEERVLKRGTGIEINSIDYNSRGLQDLYWRLYGEGLKRPVVTVLTDHADVSTVSVVDERTGELFTVPARTAGITEGLSLREYKARRRAVTTGRAPPFPSAEPKTAKVKPTRAGKTSRRTRKDRRDAKAAASRAPEEQLRTRNIRGTEIPPNLRERRRGGVGGSPGNPSRAPSKARPATPPSGSDDFSIE